MLRNILSIYRAAFRGDLDMDQKYDKASWIALSLSDQCLLAAVIGCLIYLTLHEICRMWREPPAFLISSIVS